MALNPINDNLKPEQTISTAVQLFFKQEVFTPSPLPTQQFVMWAVCQGYASWRLVPKTGLIMFSDKFLKS